LRIELFTFGDLSGTNSIKPGEWIIIATTYNLCTLNIYYNGFFDVSANETKNVTPNTDDLLYITRFEI
jgi:hypothetical protein